MYKYAAGRLGKAVFCINMQFLLHKYTDGCRERAVSGCFSKKVL